MYVVTGGAGFIGSAFLAKLNQEGIHDILVVDDLSEHPEKWRNLGNKKLHDYLHKDQFLERVTERKALPKVTAVLHFGACSTTTEPNAEYMMQNNFRYSKEVAQWAIEHNIPFIYASSAATYGDGEQGFSDEDDCTGRLRPLNVYALSKQLFDIWALESGAISHMTGVKFFNVYGPNEYHKGDMRSVVLKAYLQLLKEGKISLFKSYRANYADGMQQRDFIYVKDCNEVVWWLLQNREVKGIFNLGTGKARSWNDLAKAVCAALGKEPKIQYVDMPETLRPKYQYFTQSSIAKLKTAGCKFTFTSLEQGVRDYVTRYLQLGYEVL